MKKRIHVENKESNIDELLETLDATSSSYYRAQKTTKVPATLYAVYRNGYRVSDAEYPDTFYANSEYMYWKKIAATSNDKSVVEILPIVGT